MATRRSKANRREQKSPPVVYSSEDIHRAIFGSSPPKKKTDADLKEGIRRHLKKLRGVDLVLPARGPVRRPPDFSK